MKKHRILLLSIIVFTVLFALSVIFTFNTPTDSFEVTGTTVPLKKGDTIVQNYQFDNYNVNNIILREATYGDNLEYVNFDVSLYDKDNNIIETHNYDYTNVPDVQFFSFPVSNKDLIGEYVLKIVINDISKNGRFTIYKTDNTNIKSENFFMINKDKHGGTIAMNICGYKKGFFYSYVILAILLLLIVVLFLKIDHNSKNFINRFIDNKWSFIIYILVSCLFVFSFAYTYIIKNNMLSRSSIIINDKRILYCQLLFALLLICSTFLLYYIIHKLKDNKIKVENIYLLLVIPIGMMYMLYINPLNTPDSEFHYISAYQPIVNSYSRSDEELLPKVVADEKYNLPINIKDYRELIKKGNTYDNVQFFEKKGRYSFIDYIPTTIGIFVGKILNLSPYIGMYIAKLISFILFVIIGYLIIKIVPFGKMMFLVFLLSPTFISQSISISVDSVIFMSSLLFISYILKVKFDKKDISYKDILLLGILLILLSIQKTNYIIIGSLVFLLIDKLKKNSIKKWIYCISISMIVIGIIVTYYLGLFLPSSNSVPLNNGFLTNSSYVNSDIYRSIYVYFNTSLQMYPSYIISSFTNSLGWTASIIKIPTISIVVYFVALFYSMLYKDKNKCSFRKIDNVLLILVYIISVLFVEYALYTGWTYIGLTMISGVQGRYFVPFNILLLLYIYNKITNKRMDNQFVIPIVLIICHVINMLSVLTVIS